MQGKVSMVIPCYNKVNYIGAMLDSVIAQQWDNIEVILVNDGSTDGTREVIAAYEPKLRERGYDVVIVDQQNAGCCAAVYAGLVRMSGEYFCLVDCDDGIEPEYVSTMAGWLDEHGEYEWAACSYRCHEYVNGEVLIKDVMRFSYPQDTDRLLEKWIMREVVTTVWVYMTRVSYLKRCRMIENWCNERRRTYEPLIGVPLMAGRGKLKFFDEGLYRYIFLARDLFRFDRFEHVVTYYNDYIYLYEWAISRLDIDESEKNALRTLVKLSYQRELVNQVFLVEDTERCLPGLARDTMAVIDELFTPPPGMPGTYITEEGYNDFFRALALVILGLWWQPPRPGTRIIAYGALGQAASNRLPRFKGTPWYPTELWDAAGDGVTVLKPAFETLTAGDTMLVFPASTEVQAYVREQCKDSGARVFYRRDIDGQLALQMRYPELDGTELITC